ncbi:hypothetical protein P0L94_03555 [Microbacter sp. GSS18]|nr:hypothetical protein P0L94_03555 [Microbacter sp. GSS18]
MEDVAGTAIAVAVMVAVIGMLSVRPPWLGIPPAADLPPGDDHLDELDEFWP